MLDRLRELEQRALEEFRSAGSARDLEEARVRYLGRRGEVTMILRGLGDLSDEQRPGAGKAANDLRQRLVEAIEAARARLQAAESRARLESEALDVTLPGRWHRLGRRHPLTLIHDELTAIFVGMGFEIVEGPEIETYRYNFEVLNYPPDHPAMDEQDSFYLDDDLLLRTQTSAVQVREMENRKPPFRICTIGRCFRREPLSARASFIFHQCEALVVDKGITLADLKGTLALFARELFGPKTQVRFRPDFFPFTEPSAEYSLTCMFCGGAGCSLCKQTGWLEIGGSGMIHPNVLRAAGHDPEKVSGWAFGLGTDRLAMMRFGIDDIRLLVDNDMRFLEQF
jgi:phenylalanyl-tRNA synthetase alpha chain